MFRDERIDDLLVFLAEQTAGRVNQPPARFYEAGCRPQDGSLFCLHLGDALRRLPPFQIGIAPERAEAAARRVDQHPVDLAGQALHLRVVLVREDVRMHVRESGALQPRLELRRRPADTSNA